MPSVTFQRSNLMARIMAEKLSQHWGEDRNFDPNPMAISRLATAPPQASIGFILNTGFASATTGLSS